TLSIGLRFDLRLAILVLLPVAVLAWLPRWNLTRVIVLRWIARVYLAVALAALLMIYIVDFGHYAYLGVRINATVFRFLEDAQISTGVGWQTYPVVWIPLGWLLTSVLAWFALVRLERITLDRPAKRLKKWALVWGSVVMVLV